MSARHALSVAAAALVTAVASAASPASAEFYKGKTLTMMVNYAAGGTTDVEARIFARHLPRHLRGDPTVIVVNRPGAGGLVGINFLGGGAAKADGLTVCFCVLNAIAPIVGDPGLRVKYEDFQYVGGAAQTMVAYGRRDIPGVKTATDIARATNVFAAGYNPNTPQDVRNKITLDLIGAQFRMVSGFRGAADAMKSVSTNETNFTTTTIAGFVSSVTPNLVENGTVMPFYYFPVTTAGGGYQKNALMESKGVRPFHEVYAQVHGKPPSGPKWEAVTLVNDLSTMMLRAMFLPKGSPKEAVDELRGALAALGKDEAFIGDYKKITQLDPELVSYSDGEAVLKKLKTVTPEIAEVLKAAIAQKEATKGGAAQ